MKIICIVILFLIAPVANAKIKLIKPISVLGLYQVYENNRQQAIPNYITEDLFLLSYSMIRQRLLMEQEENRNFSQLDFLFSGLLKKIGNNEKSDAMKANRDYLMVLNTLLHGEKTKTNFGLSYRAKVELELILNAEGIQYSPLWQRSIDYSQFKPRGHYTTSNKLKRYFRAVRYSGSIVFFIKESNALGISETMANRMFSQAQLLSSYLTEGEMAKTYNQLTAQLEWQFGKSDELGLKQWLQASHSFSNDQPIEQKRDSVLSYIQQNAWLPAINGQLMDVNLLESGTSWQEASIGWALIPQKYRTDNYVFQQLVGNSIGSWQDEKFTLADNKHSLKTTPKIDNFMSLLGSDQATRRLKQQGDNNNKFYGQIFKAVNKSLDELDGIEKKHINLLRVAFTDGMKNKFNGEDRLESMKAFWTWQFYTSTLFTKQVYAPVLKSKQISFQRQGAWLEPSVQLYESLLSVVEDHINKTPHTVWNEFSTILKEIIKIAQKELDTGSLGVRDETVLNSLDLRLLPLVGSMDSPIVVDVYTDPNSQMVLQQATGLAKVVNFKMNKNNAVGARLSHHEFKQPLSNRLSNSEWRKKLTNLVQ